jgi:hypothetical protein
MLLHIVVTKSLDACTMKSATLQTAALAQLSAGPVITCACRWHQKLRSFNNIYTLTAVPGAHMQHSAAAEGLLLLLLLLLWSLGLLPLLLLLLCQHTTRRSHVAITLILVSYCIVCLRFCSNQSAVISCVLEAGAESWTKPM